jgi:hypothetical protein
LSTRGAQLTHGVRRAASRSCVVACAGTAPSGLPQHLQLSTCGPWLPS